MLNFICPAVDVDYAYVEVSVVASFIVSPFLQSSSFSQAFVTTKISFGFSSRKLGFPMLFSETSDFIEATDLGESKP